MTCLVRLAVAAHWWRAAALALALALRAHVCGSRHLSAGLVSPSEADVSPCSESVIFCRRALTAAPLTRTAFPKGVVTTLAAYPSVGKHNAGTPTT